MTAKSDALVRTTHTMVCAPNMLLFFIVYHMGPEVKELKIPCLSLYFTYNHSKMFAFLLQKTSLI